MAATEQTTAVKRRHRVDASGTAAKTSSGIKEAFIEIFSFFKKYFSYNVTVTDSQLQVPDEITNR